MAREPVTGVDRRTSFADRPRATAPMSLVAWAAGIGTTALLLLAALDLDRLLAPPPARPLSFVVPLLLEWTSALALLLVASFAWARWRAAGGFEALLIAGAFPLAAASAAWIALHGDAGTLPLRSSDGTLPTPWVAARLVVALAIFLAGAIGGRRSRPPSSRDCRIGLGGAFAVWILASIGGFLAQPADLVSPSRLATGGFAVALAVNLTALAWSLPRLHRLRPTPLTRALLAALVPLAAGDLIALVGIEERYVGGYLLFLLLTLLSNLVLLAGIWIDYYESQRALHRTALTPSGAASRIADGAQKEAVLDEPARTLAAAIETLSLGVTITDVDGRIAYINAADARLHGYQAAELLGTPANLFGSSDTDPSQLAPFSPEAGPWRRETWNRTRDGRRIPVRLISDAVRDPEGHPVGRVTVCEDLTETLQIRASIARRDRILEAVGFAAVQLLSDRPWRAALQEVLAALGRATEARIARFDLVFVAGDLAPVSLEWRAADPLHPPVEPEPGKRRRDLLASLRGAFAVDGTALSSSADIPLELLRELDSTDSGSAVLLPVAMDPETWGVLTLESPAERREFETAELDALQVAGRTIAAALHRERSRRALETTETEYRRLLDEASDLVLAIEPEGRLLFANKAARRALDLDGIAGGDRRFWEMLPPEARDSCRELFARLLASGEPAALDTILVAADGRRLEVEGRVNAQLEAGRPVAALAIFRDISERRRVEQMKRDFLSTISHELRTPLTSILGSLSLLRSPRMEGEPGRARELVEIALRNGDRLQRLISDLLDLQRLEAGGILLREGKIRIGDLLLSVVEEIEGLASSFGIRVELRDETAGAAMVADRERLIQVLMNLLSNAIKFSPPVETVLLGARVAGEEIEFRVVDHGPGIPQEFRDRLFERFAQADSSSTRRAGGSGLGLAIAKGLVDRMGGTIEVCDPPGGGAEVKIRLPIRGGAGGPAKVGAGGGKRIAP